MNFDEIGKMVFNALINAGYWVIAIITLKEVLSCGSRRDIEGIIKSILGGVVSYAALYFITDMLDKVKDVMD
jgi:hypothetical protein